MNESAYLRWIELDKQRFPSEKYPFDLDAVHLIHRLEFHPNVTYLIGDNGVGKSTLMEAVAVAYGFNPEGGSRNFTFSTRSTHSELHEYVRLARGVRKPKDGFFFRAESYYNLASNIDDLDKEPGTGASIIRSYGGKSLHEQSHGESFFSTFIHRFGGNGLYILDEPEAALSPVRQMAMLTRIHDLVKQQSQFIISTHSPILMAYPHSTIYEISKDGLLVKKLEETEHFMIYQEFLNNKARMIDELFQSNERG